MVTIEDTITEQAIAPKTIPASAPLLIPELEDVVVTVAIIGSMRAITYQI